jgi:ASC-1-like (ASCH) protein
MNYHLVILKKPYIDTILAGRKTIESRFYQTKYNWLTQVHTGDLLFLKASSGPVMATARVAAVKLFDNLNPAQIAALKEQYNHQIAASRQFWQDKMNSRFGLFVWLKDVHPIAPRFIRKADWRAWVILTQNEHFGLIDST